MSKMKTTQRKFSPSFSTMFSVLNYILFEQMSSIDIHHAMRLGLDDNTKRNVNILFFTWAMIKFFGPLNFFRTVTDLWLFSQSTTLCSYLNFFPIIKSSEYVLVFDNHTYIDSHIIKKSFHLAPKQQSLWDKM